MALSALSAVSAVLGAHVDGWKALVLDLRGLVPGWGGTRMSGAGLATGSALRTQSSLQIISSVFQNQEIEELTKICDELIAKLGKTD